ncbi:acyl carrier protein [[Clostridium] aminophilum]|uniref:acyl carrier protein n=1 Tax=[Clostridium] aminophilum TaxID=1526 RepID=UPI003F97DEDF
MDFAALKTLIVDTLDCDEDKVTPEADLREDLEADSLSVVELQMAIEDETGVKIADEELENIHTVQDILDRVKKG